MKPKTIGIIGGAGPLAGVLLVERVLSLSREIYGCHKDADFPKVFLISFPFSEMLTAHETHCEQVRMELQMCLSDLRRNGAAVLAIACNTLHVFLNEDDIRTDLIRLPDVLAEEFKDDELPLILCTSTSKRFKLHSQFFPCTYPDFKIQREIDRVIDLILKGEVQTKIMDRLLDVLKGQKANKIILGCTELSLFAKQLILIDKRVVDPLEIAAQKIIQKSFQTNEE